MTTPWTTLSRALSAAALEFARRLSTTSTTDSPPPKSTPDQTSSESEVLAMMKMMTETMTAQATETRRLVTQLMWPQLTGPTSTSQTQPELMEAPDPWAPYDAMELSPGLQAVTQREAEEERFQASQRERVALQGRLRELQEREMELLEQDSSGPPGPWDGVPGNGATSS
jgi:hypothetical protein